MPKQAITVLGLVLALVYPVRGGAQKITVYQTTPDLLEALSQCETLHFSRRIAGDSTLPIIRVDDGKSFQTMDGFGASLTDAAAWLFATKLTREQTDTAFKMLFSRADGIALSFLRQPLGSSDLAVSFYSFDDLCQQSATACTTPAGVGDPKLAHFSLRHDEAYILPLLKKALALNPAIKVMLTPWSPPGWMKSNGSMLGTEADGKTPSTLRPEDYTAYAHYLVKAVEGYEAAGVPVYALSVVNEPLYAPPTYSGMRMTAEEQIAFLDKALGPALAAARLTTKVMVYDHNWDHPEYPETVLRDPTAYALAAGIAWHHYGGDPAAMTRLHEEFPQKGEWVTESSGGTWQKGNILAQEAGELIASVRNWAKSYVLWAVATDQDHGPHVGGCDSCRGLLTLDLNSPERDRIKPEPDYYVLGQATRFLFPGAVRIGSDEPAMTGLKDVAFRNPGGEVVLYILNASATGEKFRIGFHGKAVATIMPAGSVATFIWKP